MVKNKGEEYFTEKFIPKFDSIKTAGLLLTLIIIFSFQGDAILENPLHVLIIAVPLILQNVLTAAFAYWMCKVTKQPHNVAAPAALIGASDFFELSVAVAIALFGPTSPVALHRRRSDRRNRNKASDQSGCPLADETALWY